MTSWFFNSSHQETLPATPTQTSCLFQIRVAKSSDLSAVSQIIAESFHHQHGMWGWAFPLLRLGIYEDLRHRLALPAPHHICLVAVDSTAGINHLVGTVEMTVRFSDSWKQAGRSFPYLSNLAVNPQYRRQGAASCLLQSCEQFAQNWGFQDLYLHVLENNHQAQQLYFKLGYRVNKIESSWSRFLFQRSRQMLLHKNIQNI
ncbi:MAG: GNAT family N-acetyltransferase [Calothrix sp. MO_167.B12]|nr:GNAT family N-acetyltransferase [Calothrix sp. MO_167.B12]